MKLSPPSGNKYIARMSPMTGKLPGPLSLRACEGVGLVTVVLFWRGEGERHNRYSEVKASDTFYIVSSKYNAWLRYKEFTDSHKFMENESNVDYVRTVLSFYFRVFHEQPHTYYIKIYVVYIYTHTYIWYICIYIYTYMYDIYIHFFPFSYLCCKLKAW